MTTLLKTQRTGRVQTIWFDNPPFNFLTTALMTELHDLLVSLDADPEIGAVVITSAMENVFVSHFDVAEILASAEAAPVSLTPRTASAALRASQVADHLPGGAAALARMGAGGVADLRRFHAVCALMRQSSLVVVAAINGRALGGGCEFSLSADIRLMADGEHGIGQPEVLLGLIPGGGGTQMLTRVVGAGRALELCLEGAPITPQQALEMGLVNRLLPRKDLLAEAQAVAARLARRSPTAVKAIKRAVHEGGSLPLEQGLHIERSGFLASASTPSSQRAMASYAAAVVAAGTEPDAMDSFITDLLPRLVEGTVTEFTE